MKKLKNPGNPGYLTNLKLYLVLILLMPAGYLFGQPLHYLDSLDLIGILQNNCNGCELLDNQSPNYWDTLQRVQDWPGVAVNGTRVENLILRDVGLEGNLSTLDNCTEINTLDLSQNALTGLPNLSQLSQLAFLSCSKNQIAQLPALQGLNALFYLDAEQNRISSLPSLDQTPNLQTINLSENELVTLPALDSLSNLLHLDCSRNQITQLPGFDGCPNLYNLDCSFNRLQFLPSLNDCRNLGILKVNDNDLSGLPVLDSLNLGNFDCKNNSLTFFDLEPLQSLAISGVMSYAPQDSQHFAGGADSLLLLEADTFWVSPLVAGGQGTVHHWTRDGATVTGNTGSDVPHDGTGTYTLTLTHATLNLLAIYTYPVEVFYDEGVRRFDTNGDGRGNVLDLAQIALNYGKTGPKRPDWQFPVCDTGLVPAWDWTDQQGTQRVVVNGNDTLNLKHLDNNGDGIIDAQDVGCISSLYKPLILPQDMRNQMQDSIAVGPFITKEEVFALDSHRVRIPFRIQLRKLPPGMDSVKLKGFFFSRPVVESPHYNVDTIFVRFDDSEWINNSGEVIWLDRYHDQLREEADTLQNCMDMVPVPRDVGVFMKDSARTMGAQQVLIGCIVTITDVFKHDNVMNAGLDTLPVILRTFQTTVYLEDAQGNTFPWVADCVTDTTWINPDSLLANLYPGNPADSGLAERVLGSPNEELLDTIPDGSGNPNGVLYQNHPNPFSAETEIWFEVPEPDWVNFDVLDVQGRRIREFREYCEEGLNHIIWDGRDDNGKQLENGIYYLRMRYRENQHIRKLIVMHP